MNKFSFDVVVIGTGPAGEAACIKLLKNKLSVAVVERYNMQGGNSVHYGTIPSKYLRQIIQKANKINNFPIKSDKINYTFPEIVKAGKALISNQMEIVQSNIDRNDAKWFIGHGSFLDENTLSVLSKNGEQTLLTAKKFVIATGSRPYRPDFVDFTHPRIFDSEKILDLEYNPKRCIIFGAGVIGSEYASILKGLGISITLINQRDSLLSFLDDEIVHALNYKLMDMGVRIYHNENCTDVQADEDGVSLVTESKKRVRGDILLWTNGRTGNTDKLGLDKIGLKPDNRGNLSVDEYFRTDLKHVYAIGDVIGFPSLASASFHQGYLVGDHILGKKIPLKLGKLVPTGIYTNPEISSIGPTEKELTKEKVPYEVGHAWFKNIARARITGNVDGMLKIIFHRESYKILAIHCFGDQASEIIHIGQAIMSQPKANDVRYFVNTTFNYPTMAEAYRVAALNGINRLK